MFFFILFSGVACIAISAWMEMRWLARESWTSALITLDPPPEMEMPPDALALRMCPVSRDHSVAGDDELKALQMLFGAEMPKSKFRMDAPEDAFAIAIPREDLEPLLLSGRLPEPGAYEALAGDLAREEAFTIGGQTFTVVGRLKPTVSGLLFAYLILDHPRIEEAFAGAEKIHKGWLAPQGMEALSPEEIRTDKPAATYIGGQYRTRPIFFYLTFHGMILAAIGAFGIQTWLFRRGSSNDPFGFFTPIFYEVAYRPRLWYLTHLGAYGLFFLAMLESIQNPLSALRMQTYISLVFNEGGLDYIGKAYLSGSVFKAAVATFQNNYLFQTVILTFLFSLCGIPLGVIKNGLSFLMSGLLMAPVWAHTSTGYVLHILTIVLEFEAYILACFAVLVWSARLFTAVRRGGREGLAQLLTGVRSMGGAILICGGILAVAALYEAATLIYMM